MDEEFAHKERKASQVIGITERHILAAIVNCSTTEKECNTITKRLVTNRKLLKILLVKEQRPEIISCHATSVQFFCYSIAQPRSIIAEIRLPDGLPQIHKRLAI